MLGKSVFEVKHTMPVSEYNGWQRYLAIEPFGGENLQLALLAYITSIANGGKGKLEDFLISLHTQNKETSLKDEPVSTSQVKSIFGAIAKSKPD